MERDARSAAKIAQLEEQVKTLHFTLIGVMHFVDKWLDGGDLKKDRISRAIAMREKTLKIVEGLEAKIERMAADAERARKREQFCYNNVAKTLEMAMQEIDRLCVENDQLRSEREGVTSES